MPMELQIGVYRAAVMLLSCPGKKVTKEAGIRGAELIAPAIKAVLLRISRPASPVPLEHLNFKSVHHKNVPIFAMQR